MRERYRFLYRRRQAGAGAFELCGTGRRKADSRIYQGCKKQRKNSVIPTKKPFHLWKIGDMVCYMLKMLPMLPAMKKYSSSASGISQEDAKQKPSLCI